MNKNANHIRALAIFTGLLAFSIGAPSFAGPSADIRRLEVEFNAAYGANSWTSISPSTPTMPSSGSRKAAPTCRPTRKNGPTT